MPLIHCPNCGQPISDKATLCPHCNNQNWNPTAPDTLTCAECGALYGKEESSCPACGCPNNTNAPKKKHKGVVVAAIILSVILAIGVFTAFAISKGNAMIYYDNLEHRTIFNHTQRMKT